MFGKKRRDGVRFGMGKINKLKTEEFKQKCLDYLGGKKCYRCGTESWTIAAFDFDHINGGTKEFQLSKASCKPWKDVKKELDKCVIMCSNCHRDRHYLKEIIFKDETGTGKAR